MENEISLRIQAAYGDLRPSEKRVADHILEHMEELRSLSIDQLAKRCGVSQPTVVRMIKAMGFGGYKELRYAAVEELAKKDGGYPGKDRCHNREYGGRNTEKYFFKDILPGHRHFEQSQEDRYLQRGKLQCDGSGSSDEASFFGL